MGSLEDQIADVVLAKFETLPAKSKPTNDTDGIRNWVPLSGIVISTAEDTGLTCVALATGMKCLPVHKVKDAQGFVLHDWHAEILAIRAFNHFLMEECFGLANSKTGCSPYVRWREEDEVSAIGGIQPFTINESLKIHMYCSEAPCGDASMELTMNAQEDPTPWPVPTSADESMDSLSNLKGRQYFSELGIVRRKPARPDSPPTLSKSCSDKLALKQCTSLLSSTTSLLVCPVNAYLDTLVIPSSQCNFTACERSFGLSGRLGAISSAHWKGGYHFQPLHIRTTDREFKLSRRSATSPTDKLRASNISAVRTPTLHETLINGVLQGRKQSDARGGSVLCRRNMWAFFCSIAVLVKDPVVERLLSIPTYSTMKNLEVLKDRIDVKSYVQTTALKGWIRNERDDFPTESER